MPVLPLVGSTRVVCGGGTQVGGREGGLQLSHPVAQVQLVVVLLLLLQ